jgi:hypothetical protein
MKNEKSNVVLVSPYKFEDEFVQIAKLRINAELFEVMIKDVEVKADNVIKDFKTAKVDAWDGELKIEDVIVPFNLAEAKRKLHDIAILTQELKDDIYEIYMRLSSLVEKGYVQSGT